MDRLLLALAGLGLLALGAFLGMTLTETGLPTGGRVVAGSAIAVAVPVLFGLYFLYLSVTSTDHYEPF